MNECIDEKENETTFVKGRRTVMTSSESIADEPAGLSKRRAPFFVCSACPFFLSSSLLLFSTQTLLCHLLVQSTFERACAPKEERRDKQKRVMNTKEIRKLNTGQTQQQGRKVRRAMQVEKAMLLFPLCTYSA